MNRYDEDYGFRRGIDGFRERQAEFQARRARIEGRHLRKPVDWAAIRSDALYALGLGALTLIFLAPGLVIHSFERIQSTPGPGYVTRDSARSEFNVDNVHYTTPLSVPGFASADGGEMAGPSSGSVPGGAHKADENLSPPVSLRPR